jgi:hypothetical protein
LSRLYRRRPLAVSKHEAFIGSSYPTHLDDVIPRVAGIEATREGELDDVIALDVLEVLAVLLRVHDEASVQIGPSVLTVNAKN